MIGSNIKARREQQGLTQVQLAALAQCHPSHVAKIEQGVLRDPGVSVLSRIAEAVGCSLDDLLSSSVVS